jgi:phosphate:Na+ symporter
MFFFVERIFNLNATNIWELLAGLGIFLFGMLLLEEAIRNLSDRTFKKIIHRYTEGKIRSVLAGTFATAILQSSSAVSLMVLAFAGAGIMSMGNAIGVILGSNIGTTLTSWIVATVGFKLNIELLSLPFIGIGGLGLIFLGKSKKGIHFSRLLVGFGFLFMGLDYMKRSFDFLSAEFDVASLPDYGAWFYVLIGFALTALVQSSSAAMAIILTGVFSGVLSLDKGFALVIGTNIGTTLTILLGSLSGTPIKKRVAYSHFFFNFFTALFALILLPFLSYFIADFLQFSKDPVIGLALFHTIFNVLGVLLFLPFINPFARLITRIVPEKKSNVSLYLKNFSTEIPEVAEAAITAMEKETYHLVRQVMNHNLSLFGIDKKLVFTQKEVDIIKSMSYKEEYILIKELQADIFEFSSHVQTNQLLPEETAVMHKTLHSVQYAVASAKALKDVRHDLDELQNSENAFLNQWYHDYRKKLIANYLVISEVLEEDKIELNMPSFIRLMENLHQGDDHFSTSLSGAINQHKIKDLLISTLLSANRGFNTSLRDIILAVKELKLNRKEEAIFENLQNLNDPV